MPASHRVNLSLTDRVYRALSEYAGIVGRTRTAIVVEVMGYHLERWEREIRSHRARVRYDRVERIKSEGARGGSQARWNERVNARKAEKAKR